MSMLRTIFLLTIITITLQASYERYCNARFNFCVDIDTNWGKEPTPTNNDGRSFFDHDGFKMSVWGSYNALMQSLKEAMDSTKSDFDQVTYSVIKNNWYVLSGYKGSDIVYIKTFLKNETFFTLRIQYPEKLKATYNPITAQLAKSFKVPQ